ncbi:DUF1120 domain-containing protein [Citrobacter koseri]|uniref:DUF1120 domain-containing protein n=1 Tax=Citrobacter koseri TaxID=545 RepID=UPI001B9E690A|nr:DUF1120 domain-containing protein [Citrobacter koseri]CAG0292817.1 hypothetical protein AN2353V1_4102 [Citrobacter koseri]CAH6189727.1 hypothetical protein AN2353V1_4102 [Citrobacter koseri]HBC8592709.1 DUF1120 domain-containing protein [Citrobacter koseri]HCT9896501.1 DUF1120 domain-containing protein [Citrobacter koseri]
MNVFFKKSLMVSVLALTASSVMAAPSVDIKVSGKIVPASCIPSFPSGGGIADFGTIKVASLNSTAPTALPDIKTVPVAITCEEDTRVGVSFTDMHSASAPTTGYAINFASTDFISSANYLFGLGLYGSQKIGAYALGIQIDSGTLTNGNGDNLVAYFSANDGTTWGTKAGNSYMQIINNNSEVYSFGKSSASAPEPQTKVNFNVGVSAIINPTDDLQITDEATLDGLTTVELVYL